MIAAPTITMFSRGGLTVVARPQPGAGVVAEAWLGGGLADGDRELVHLAEHVAVAQAGGELDGRVTPDATIVRGRGATLAAACGPLWRAMTLGRACPTVVRRERAAVRAETGAAIAAIDDREISGFWRAAWRARRATLVVSGGFEPTELTALVAAWPGRGAPTRRRGGTAALAAAAVAATATGRAHLRSRRFVIDRDAVLRWPDAADDDAWMAARIAARALPVVGADGWIGETAAALHVAGDPTWPARYRAAVMTTTAAQALRWAPAVRRAARAPKTPTRAPRPTPAIAHTTLGSAHVVAAHRDGDSVTLRWTWQLGADPDGVAPLVAAALTRCFAAGALDGGGVVATAVLERDRLGVRARVPRVGWAQAVAEIAACIAAPDRDPDGHARDRDHLRQVAAALAHSGTARAVAAFARHGFPGHPLAAATAVAPAPVDVDAMIAWWATRRRGAAVLAAVGPVTLDALVAASGLTAQPAAATVPTVVAAPGELYVDGAPGDSAVLVGFATVGAGHVDRGVVDVIAALLAQPGRLPSGARVAIADTVDAGYLAIVVDHVIDRAATIAALHRAIAELPTDPASLAAGRADALARRRGDDAERLADDLALAAITGAAPRAEAIAAVDAVAVIRVRDQVLARDRAVVVTVRAPDELPAVERRRRARPRRRR